MELRMCVGDLYYMTVDIPPILWSCRLGACIYSPPPRVPHSQTPRFSNTAPPAVQKIE